jgi:hypothetical protein
LSWLRLKRRLDAMDSDRIDSQPAPLRLTLELGPEGTGMTGLLYDELGVEHPFSGWLGLLTLLEAAQLRTQHRPISGA